MDISEINVEELLNKLKVLEEENKILEEENSKLKLIFENYNNSRKKYYENNKDIVKQRAKEGLKKITEENPEKIKQYRRTAYLNRKEKLKNIENN